MPATIRGGLGMPSRTTAKASGRFQTIPLATEVNHVYGNTATLLRNSSYKAMLVLVAESGDWRFRVGDYTGSPPAAPGASVTNGSGSLLLVEGTSLIVSAPETITAVGSAADAILTYYWV